MKLRKRLFSFTLLFIVFFQGGRINVIAQSETFLSRSSVGPMLGGSYYIGDLNPYGHFEHVNPAIGLVYRYYVNSRIELKAGVRYAQVSADDAMSSIELHRMRNLSFESDIYEISGGIEFNYFNYKLGDAKYFWTPYMFIDIAFFQMNPMTEYNGEMIELQPLGTEGQGSNLNSSSPYSLTQFAIPFGVGVKFNLSKGVAISLEYGIRKTFTDYLDDVGGDYVDQVALSTANGDLAARLADRSIGGFQAVGPRGNSATNDWYSIFGAMITFPLGKESKCFYR